MDEEVLAPTMPDEMAKLFGGANTAEHTQRLGDSLAGRRYPSLRLTTRIFPEATHFTLPPILVAHGLRNVFAAE